MPRGGKRVGTPGKAYANRTDLGGQNVVGPRPAATGKVPIQTAPNQAQGNATAQREAQKVIPMGGNAPVQLPAAPPPSPLTSLFAPTSSPNEPVTTGVDMGSGAGSAILNLGQNSSRLSDSLAELLAYDPTGEVAILYQEALSQGN